MWWLGIIREGSYFACGTGGQYLIVAPKQELVIVNRLLEMILAANPSAKEGYSD